MGAVAREGGGEDSVGGGECEEGMAGVIRNSGGVRLVK